MPSCVSPVASCGLHLFLHCHTDCWNCGPTHCLQAELRRQKEAPDVNARHLRWSSHPHCALPGGGAAASNAPLAGARNCATRGWEEHYPPAPSAALPGPRVVKEDGFACAVGWEGSLIAGYRRLTGRTRPASISLGNTRRALTLTALPEDGPRRRPLITGGSAPIYLPCTAAGRDHAFLPDAAIHC